jgi:hypothetical protein
MDSALPCGWRCHTTTIDQSPDPEFSDEARRAKLPKGWLAVVVVSLVAAAQGNPQRIAVVRHEVWDWMRRRLKP